MTAPAITFAIPYYSGLEFLERTLASVIAQTDPDWRCVVCDDSDDARVAGVVARVARGRIAYAKNPTNLGMAANFNRCVDIAETDLVTVLHADDELEPAYTATMRAAAARHPTAAAVFCNAVIIGPNSEPRFSLADFVKTRITPSAKHEVILQGEPGMRALLQANFIVAPTLCFRTSVLGARRFATNVRFIMDLELTTKLLLDGEALVGIPDRVYRYRRHDENATEHLTRSQLRYREESDYYDRMREVSLARGWQACARVAGAKRILKLNVMYRAFKSAALLRFADAHRNLQLLREL